MNRYTPVLCGLLATSLLGCTDKADNDEEFIPDACCLDEPIVECPEEVIDTSFPRPLCNGDLTCNYGMECCCGECHSETVCRCYDGEFSCDPTDACYIESCPDGGFDGG